MQATFIKEDRKERQRCQPLSPYLIKKALLNQHNSRCARCYRRTVPVRLYRVHKKSKQPKRSDYIILCSECIAERRERQKQEKKRLWTRKKANRKISPAGFWNRIRKQILKRDGYECVWCDSKEHLGLGPLIPLSRGGKLTFENYVCTCASCRPSKGNKLPLEFIAESIFINEYLNEQLDQALTVKDPGKNISIRFRLFAEVSSFLHRLTNDDKIPSATRTRAELLNIKMLS